MRRLRWPLGSVAFLLALPVALFEGAYRVALSRVSERPAMPVPRLPPVVMRAASLELLDAPAPESGGIYLWTVAVAIAAPPSERRPRSASALAARYALAEAPKRRHVSWLLAEFALTIWISRHLTGAEALATAVSMMPFGRGASHPRRLRQLLRQAD